MVERILGKDEVSSSTLESGSKFTQRTSFRTEPNSIFAVWCKGSTRDSGSLSLGSNPGTATIFKRQFILETVAFCFKNNGK